MMKLKLRNRMSFLNVRVRVRIRVRPIRDGIECPWSCLVDPERAVEPS
jgi:hypothetical protein